MSLSIYAKEKVCQLLGIVPDSDQDMETGPPPFCGDNAIWINVPRGISMHSLLENPLVKVIEALGDWLVCKRQSFFTREIQPGWHKVDLSVDDRENYIPLLVLASALRVLDPE